MQEWMAYLRKVWLIREKVGTWNHPTPPLSWHMSQCNDCNQARLQGRNVQSTPRGDAALVT